MKQSQKKKIDIKQLNTLWELDHTPISVQN